MFKRIMFCTDLSKTSETLFSCIQELKKLKVEEIILIHVLDFYAIRTALDGVNTEIMPPEKRFESLEIEIKEAAEKKLVQQSKILEENGFNVKTEMPYGIPSRTINELANKYDCSAILIGSHGKGIFKNTFLGGVSFDVLNNSTRPVLLYRVGTNDGKMIFQCKSLLDNILYLTDFSQTSKKAFDYLEKIVELTNAPVTIHHVHPKSLLNLKFSTDYEEIKARNYEKLEELKIKLEKAGSTNVEIDIAIGDPGRAILARLENKEPEKTNLPHYSERSLNEQDYSLVVMGSQGQGFVKQLFLGSISNKVALFSAVPVLFITGDQEKPK